MLSLNLQGVRHVDRSDWLYGFILHHLNLGGETIKQALLDKVRYDVQKAFPNLDSDYFMKEYDNANNIFMTLFYFAIFHLREKGYGLVRQRIKENKPVISLSPIGREFLKTPAGKHMFIDYQDIEQFLKRYYPALYKRATLQIERYRQDILKISAQHGHRDLNSNHPKITSLWRAFLSRVRLLDFLLILLLCLIFAIALSLGFS